MSKRPKTNRALRLRQAVQIAGGERAACAGLGVDRGTLRAALADDSRITPRIDRRLERWADAVLGEQP